MAVREALEIARPSPPRARAISVKDLLPLSLPYPPLPQLFQPITIEASIENPVVGETFKAEIPITVLEKMTDRGVPSAPVAIYVQNEKVASAACDGEGRYTHELTLEERRRRVEVQLDVPLPLASPRTMKVLWDGFEDRELDTTVWTSYRASGPFPGHRVLRQRRGRIEFDVLGAGYLAGIHTKTERYHVDMAGGRISVELKTDGYAAAGLSILPETKPNIGVSYNEGYDIVLWELGIHKFMIYSNYGEKKLPKGPIYHRKSLAGNPETIEVTLDEEGIIHFFEDGTERYSEEYKPDTTVSDIYLFGQSWYVGAGGIPWADNFICIEKG